MHKSASIARLIYTLKKTFFVSNNIRTCLLDSETRFESALDLFPVFPFLALVEPDRLVTFLFSHKFQVHGWFTFSREHLTLVPPIGSRRHRRCHRRDYFSRLGYH